MQTTNRCLYILLALAWLVPSAAADSYVFTTIDDPNGGVTFAEGINDLGQTFTEYGFANLATAGWIADTNGIESDNNLTLYALSSVITVPQASSTPEPGTLGLTACAALLLFGVSRVGRRHALPN